MGARLVIALALIVGAADAVTPTIGPIAIPVAPESTDPCAAPAIAALLPGRSSEFHAVSHHIIRNTSASDPTVLSIMALARASGESLNFTDVANFTEDTFDTCALNVTSEADVEGTLRALAVGGLTGQLPPNATLLMSYRTHHQHNVSLDMPTALAAMAFANANGTVHWRDVVTMSEANETTFEQARVVRWDRSAALEDVVIPPAPAAADPPAAPAPPPSAATNATDAANATNLSVAVP